jgi:hypothetical protein
MEINLTNPTFKKTTDDTIKADCLEQEGYLISERQNSHMKERRNVDSLSVQSEVRGNVYDLLLQTYETDLCRTGC